MILIVEGLRVEGLRVHKIKQAISGPMFASIRVFTGLI